MILHTYEPTVLNPSFCQMSNINATSMQHADINVHAHTHTDYNDSFFPSDVQHQRARECNGKQDPDHLARNLSSQACNSKTFHST
jgi:hypothetical protein